MNAQPRFAASLRLSKSFARAWLGTCLLAATGLTSLVAHAETGYKVHLQDADIKAFIDQVASITHKNFVLDPRVNGNVTVIANKTLSEQEVYDLFLAVMKVNGIVAINRGDITELVPDSVAKQSGIDVDLRGRSSGSQMTTRIFYLTNTNANDILNVLRPMMPPYANATAVNSLNAVILSDRADHLNEYAKLIANLDNNVNDQLTVIPLRHVDPKRMMDLLNSLIGTAGGGTSSASAQGQGGQGSGVSSSGSNGLISLIADPAADRLLVKGSPELTAKVRQMVEQLDTVSSKRLSGLRVFRLKYASAPHIADMLRALLAYQSINSAGDPSTLQATSMFDNNNTNSTTTNTNTTNESSPTGSPISTSTTNTASINSTSNTGRPFSIIADQTQNSVIVNASPELMPEIEAAIEQLDSRRDQVLIQAAIMEVSGNDTQQLGVQWALGSANSGIGIVNFSNVGAGLTNLATEVIKKTPGSAAAAVSGAFLGLGDSRVNSSGNREFYGAILQAIDKTNSANLLSMPSIVTLDNEKANILVGQNVPFVTGSYTTNGNSSTNPFQTITRQDVGVNLNVIPHIGDNGTVRLEISQEVSSLVESTLNNTSGVVTNKNLIRTTVLADDQQTIALGGLMRDNSTYNQQKVPGLGDLPGIGGLFRSKSKNADKTNLIVFLQPTILRNGSAVASVTERSLDGIRTMQLVIDKNGTLKQLPLNVPPMYPNPAPVPRQGEINIATNDLVRPTAQNLTNTPVAGRSISQTVNTRDNPPVAPVSVTAPRANSTPITVIPTPPAVIPVLDTTAPNP